MMAYNLETILAEKLETVLSRNLANTRPRDYYDIHILYSLRFAECDRNSAQSTDPYDGETWQPHDSEKQPGNN